MANQYFTCVLDAWRDGTTLYGRMHYYRTSGTYFYQDTSFPDPTMNLGGTTYSDTTLGNLVRGGVNVGDIYGATFSRTIAGTGTRTVTYTAGSGQRSDFAGTWSVDVGGFPGTSSPPTGLSCSDIVRGQDNFSATVSITGWGENNTGTVDRYRELQVWTESSSGLVEPRRYQAVRGDSLSGTITCGNSSSGSLTIVPNTGYTIGVYATNGASASGSTRIGNYSTLPPTTTISNVATTTTSADFTYSVPNQGGKYNMTLKYQLDSGSLTTVTTLSGSGTKSGTFTVSGLQPETTHTITASLTTTAGEVVSNTVTFTTDTPPAIHKLYGSANGVAKKINKLYGPVEVQVTTGVTGAIRSGATQVTAFDADTFFAAASSSLDLTKTMSYVWVYMIKKGSDVQHRLRVYYSDDTYYEFFSSGSIADYATYGITASEYTGTMNVTDYIDLTPETTTQTVAKKISKLYGSANGVTKLIFEDT